MSNPLDRLRQFKNKAEAGSQAGSMFKQFIAHAKENLGWTPEDVEEYRGHISTLMRGTPDEALALYPAGFYANADDARQAAVDFWRTSIKEF